MGFQQQIDVLQAAKDRMQARRDFRLLFRPKGVQSIPSYDEMRRWGDLHRRQQVLRVIERMKPVK